MARLQLGGARVILPPEAARTDTGRGEAEVGRPFDKVKLLGK